MTQRSIQAGKMPTVIVRAGMDVQIEGWEDERGLRQHPAQMGLEAGTGQRFPLSVTSGPVPRSAISCYLTCGGTCSSVKAETSLTTQSSFSPAAKQRCGCRMIAP